MPELKRVSIISPCFNEQDVIEAFYHRIKQTILEWRPNLKLRVIIVDDGSDDSSLRVLNALAEQESPLHVYSFARNFGHQTALSAGVDVAWGDAIVLMDCDLQHPPEIVLRLLEKYEAGYDVVTAVRKRTVDTGWFKNATSNSFYAFFNWMSDIQITPGAADFVCLSRRAYIALRKMPERHRFLRGMIGWLGFPQARVEYMASRRHAGTSKYTLNKMILLAANAIFSFTSRPIRYGIRVGVFTTFMGFCYLVYIITKSLIHGHVEPGWPSILSTVIILGGVQLSFLGIVGEYVARLFEEAKRRPIYVLKQRPRRARRPRTDGQSSAHIRVSRPPEP